jgi:outer membrane protein OmpA-like peptidoglycan-associated protein/polyhydroxyalkanoate synthesis regulator phasin
MKKLIVIPFIVFFFQSMEAQNNRNQAVSALNLYVDYCNETIHGMWSICNTLRSFNHSVYNNQTNPQYPRTLPAYSTSPSFEEDVFHNEEYYQLIPDKIYEKCLIESKILGSNQAILNEKLNTLKNTVNQIEKLQDSLIQYTQEKQFNQDVGYEKVLRILKNAEIATRQYKKQKDDLIAEVTQVYEKLYKPTATSPQQKIIQSNNQFLPALQVCKKMIDDMLANKTDQLPTYVKQLEEMIAGLKANQAKNLEGLYRFGRNNGLDPDWRYETTVSDLEAVKNHGKSFLIGTDNYKPGYYEYFPKSFYFYNERLINKYNRYGLGVVQAFNKFIDLANGKNIQKEAGIDDYYIKNGSIKFDNSATVLLKWAEEPHQFFVIPFVKNQQSTLDVPIKTTVRPPELDLSKVEVGKNITLENIYFKIAEYELLPESFTELDKIVKFMQENTQTEILLEGHTDFIGNANDNMKLSENRVKAVKNYLTQKDIASKRIQIKWYGGTKPIKTDGTDEQRKINRRVTFTLLKK